MQKIPFSILLVEDNCFDQHITHQLIERTSLQNAQLTICDSAIDALDLLTSEYFDCCLFDLSMPGKGGQWLLEEYLKVANNQTAMIALTDNRDPALVAELMQKGAHGYIAKNAMSPTVIESKITAAINFRNIQHSLYQQAHEDTLTSLLNRNAFSKQLSRLLPRLTAGNQEGILLFLDIDNFKQINDTYGHAVGDAILKKFSAKLSVCCRPQDILGRLGGDEFVIFMPNTPLSEAELIMNRLQYQLRTEVLCGTHAITVSTSIGAACFPTHGHTQEQLLHVADQALYQSKRNGRARLSVYQQNNMSV